MRRFPNQLALVVDDEPSTRTLLRAALEEIGFAVTEAVDGADAIHQALLAPVDLITMDIMMPNVDGLDAIRALRTVDPECRIVVVSSCCEEAILTAVRELTVPHFVRKPVQVDDLYAAVDAELSTVPSGAAEAEPGDEG